LEIIRNGESNEVYPCEGCRSPVHSARLAHTLSARLAHVVWLGLDCWKQSSVPISLHSQSKPSEREFYYHQETVSSRCWVPLQTIPTRRKNHNTGSNKTTTRRAVASLVVITSFPLLKTLFLSIRIHHAYPSSSCISDLRRQVLHYEDLGKLCPLYQNLS